LGEALSECGHLKAPFPENSSTKHYDNESLQAVFDGRSKWLQDCFVAFEKNEISSQTCEPWGASAPAFFGLLTFEFDGQL
jgi:hypothetical protein